MRQVLRKPAVLAATGWSNSTLYMKISAGVFPKPIRLDPNGRAVVWFQDEVEAFQEASDRSRFHRWMNPPAAHSARLEAVTP
jgi:predicted DNA-binding transcriptional regulator AlpA